MYYYYSYWKIKNNINSSHYISLGQPYLKPQSPLLPLAEKGRASGEAISDS